MATFGGDIPSHLSTVYGRFIRDRKLLDFEGERLVIFDGSIDRDADAVVELIRRGFLQRRRIGLRKVLVLGTWDVIERRFNDDSEHSTILTDRMMQYLPRYTEYGQKVIEAVFESFAHLRKLKRVSPNILLTELKYYAGFPADVVIDALEEYLARHRFKGERYARGMIRGFNKDRESSGQGGAHDEEARETTESTGSTVDEREAALAEQRRTKREEKKRMNRLVLQLAEEKGLEPDDLTPETLTDLMREITNADPS